MFTTYILFSEKLNRYYIGSTSDLNERLKKHLSNHKGFTSNADDWKIVYFEEFQSIELARKRELQIKKWKSRKMIEVLIKNKV